MGGVMKKLRVLAVVLLSVMCLTGCVRFNTTINVKSNGKLDVSMLYATVDMSEYGMGDIDLLGDTADDLEEDGWTVEEYSEDNFSGFLISKENISADELKGSMEDSDSEIAGSLDSIKFTKDGFKYVLDWQVFDRDESEQMSDYKGYFNMSGGYMTLTVKLPVKPTESNATRVSDDGKTLEWDLLDLGPDQNIHLEFSLLNTKTIIIATVVIELIILAVVVTIVLAIRSSRKKKERMRQQAYPYYPQNMPLDKDRNDML